MGSKQWTSPTKTNFMWILSDLVLDPFSSWATIDSSHFNHFAKCSCVFFLCPFPLPHPFSLSPSPSHPDISSYLSFPQLSLIFSFYLWSSLALLWYLLVLITHIFKVIAYQGIFLSQDSAFTKRNSGIMMVSISICLSVTHHISAHRTVPGHKYCLFYKSMHQF